MILVSHEVQLQEARGDLALANARLRRWRARRWLHRAATVLTGIGGFLDVLAARSRLQRLIEEQEIRDDARRHP